MAIQTVLKRSLFAAMLLFVAFPACAENAVVGTGTPASCTETTFNAALALVVNDNQGGVLTFNCGPDPDVILLSSVKNLINFVVIDGGGKMTLSGQDLTRLFNINQDGVDGRTEVTLRNIVLTRGNSGAQPFGGAILVNANTALNLDSVTISNSLATTSGGAIATFANVGLNIINSKFLGNLAANGGAIATRAVVNVSGSTFTNNNASGGEGGAIQSYEQNLSIAGSTFASNGANDGGAIYKSGGALKIAETSLDQNTSVRDGGAIYGFGDINLIVLESNYLRRNRAGQLGGAMYMRGDVFILQSSFFDNSASLGGALSVTGALIVEKSTFANNMATLRGGAVALSAISNFTPNPSLRYVTTSNNTVTAGEGGDFYLFADSFKAGEIRNSTLMGASASNGGSSVHGQGPISLQFSDSLIWPGAGTACVSVSGSSFSSSGGNFGPTNCALTGALDSNLTSFPAFVLGEFANYGGAHNSYLPLATSPALERGRSCQSRDARAKSSPVDSDGNGSSDCDAGAVERQLVETQGALFRNGFESAVSIQQ